MNSRSSSSPQVFRPWILVIVLICLTASFGYLWHTQSIKSHVVTEPFSVQEPQRTSLPPPAAEKLLRHPFPTDAFRDNLLEDEHYITGWAVGGFTNEFLAYIHLIYLGFLSERIPIVPPFVPIEHIPWTTPPLEFGDVFNLTTLQSHLKRPVIQWSQVKKIEKATSLTAADFPYKNNHTESLGCWSTRSRHEAQPARSGQTHSLLGLDVSYTRVPDFAFNSPAVKASADVVYSGLAATIATRGPYPTDDLPLMAPSPLGQTLRPDKHLACYDHLYYAMSGVESYEWKYSWSPEWRVVGMHLPFTQPLIDLAKAYLSRIYAEEMQTTPSGQLPHLITVHIRRGDFAGQCFNDKPCRIGTEKFAQAVEEVKKQLKDDNGLEVGGVFVTSDESDSRFWDEVTGLGWKHINHTAERTLALYGDWYPPLIDAVALSLGVGFVGTLDSTFSTLSARRVEDWNNGVSRLVHRHLDED